MLNPTWVLAGTILGSRFVMCLGHAELNFFVAKMKCCAPIRSAKSLCFLRLLDLVLASTARTSSISGRRTGHVISLPWGSKFRNKPCSPQVKKVSVLLPSRRSYCYLDPDKSEDMSSGLVHQNLFRCPRPELAGTLARSAGWLARSTTSDPR